MDKMALCFNANEALDILQESEYFDHTKLLSLKTQLVSRTICETDLNTLQIIPYITLVDKESGKMFIYTRGSAGDENRLHGTCSIGLGGHVDDECTDGDLASHLANEASRELHEEAGVSSISVYTALKEAFKNGNFFVLQERTTRVGRVHIGISTSVLVNMNEVSSFEAGVITKGQWLALPDIIQKAEAGEFKMEEWTNLVGLTLLTLASNAKGIIYDGVFLPKVMQEAV